MAGVVAGIFLIILGANVAGSTSFVLEKEYCFNTITQANTSVANITSYTNDIICDTYTYPFNANIRLAIGSLFMLLGLGYILYIYGTLYEKKKD
ncbi:MAG: hypothetical protein U9Q97_03750 [Acidobacteriota bacterium]|nr:hypothetical protein [Acidobacteriota bacterium]